MARITVEDCIDKVPGRFDLVLLAAQRAKDLANGAMLTLQRDNDKNPVVALREIAEGGVTVPALQESLVRSLQKSYPREAEEEDLDSILAADGIQEDQEVIVDENDLEEAGFSAGDEPQPANDDQ